MKNKSRFLLVILLILLTGFVAESVYSQQRNRNREVPESRPTNAVPELPQPKSNPAERIGSMSMDKMVALLGLESPPARGDTGQAISDDTAWRTAWIRFQNNVIAFLRNHPPTAARVVYSPEVRQGAVNYSNNTVQVFVDVQFLSAPPIATDLLSMINGANEELNKTGRNSDWKLGTITPQNVWLLGTREPQVRIWGDLTSEDKAISGSAFSTSTASITEHFPGQHQSPGLSFTETGVNVAERNLAFSIQIPVAAFERGVTVRLSGRAGSYVGETREVPLPFNVQILTKAAFAALSSEERTKQTMQTEERIREIEITLQTNIRNVRRIRMTGNSGGQVSYPISSPQNPSPVIQNGRITITIRSALVGSEILFTIEDISGNTYEAAEPIKVLRFRTSSTYQLTINQN